MNAVAQINTAQFTQALRAYKLATNKSEPEILNRAGRNLAFRAAQNTPVSTPGNIRSGLFKDPHLRYALTSILLKSRSGLPFTAKQLKRSPFNRLAVKGKLEKGEFQRAVNLFVSRRVSSSKYLRAGWALAIEQLGGQFRGVKFRGAEGFANKAVARRLVTEVVNILNQPDAKHASSAEAIGLKAIQAAVDFVAEDMRAYAQNIIDGHARAISH